jgi:hypothetical protein
MAAGRDLATERLFDVIDCCIDRMSLLSTSEVGEMGLVGEDADTCYRSTSRDLLLCNRYM